MAQPVGRWMAAGTLPTKRTTGEAKAKTEEKMEKKAKDATAPAQPASQAQAGQDESEEDCPQGQTCPEKKKAQSGSAAGAGASDASW